MGPAGRVLSDASEFLIFSLKVQSNNLPSSFRILQHVGKAVWSSVWLENFSTALTGILVSFTTSLVGIIAVFVWLKPYIVLSIKLCFDVNLT